MRIADWIFAALATVAVGWALAAVPDQAQIMATVLLVPLPVLSIVQARILARTDLTKVSRMSLYATSVFTLWTLAFASLAAAQASGFPAAIVGFDRITMPAFVSWTLFLFAAAAALFALTRYLDWPESPALLHVLPRTRLEKLIFVFVAFTAGITEEIIFRGFLIAALAVVMPNLWLAAIASSVAFGMLHAYQGRVGIGRTALTGFVLAVPFVMTSSIMPGIVAHTMIDLVGGLLLTGEESYERLEPGRSGFTA